MASSESPRPANAHACPHTPTTRHSERLDRTLAIANEKSTAFCSYAICIMILLGLGTVVYNVVVG